MAVGDPHVQMVTIETATVVMHFVELAGHGPWASALELDRIVTTGVADLTLEARDGAGVLVWAADLEMAAAAADTWTVRPSSVATISGTDVAVIVTPAKRTARVGGATRQIPERPL